MPQECLVTGSADEVLLRFFCYRLEKQLMSSALCVVAYIKERKSYSVLQSAADFLFARTGEW